MCLKKLSTVLWLCVVGFDVHAQMTVRQSLEIREPRNLSFSPSGKQIAYVVEQAVLSTNTYQQTLYVVPTAGGTPRAIVSVERMGAVQWSADGSELIYLAKTSGAFQAWSVGSNGGAPRQLTRHAAGIGAGIDDDQFEWNPLFQIAPDGRRAIFFTRDKVVAQRQLDELRNGGFLYTPAHSYVDVDSMQYGWQKMPAATASLWVVDLETGRERRIWHSAAPLGLDVGYPPIEFAWSPNGKYVALIWSDKRNPTLRRNPLVLLSGDTFAPQDSLPTLGDTHTLAWDVSGESLTFESEGEVSEQTDIRFNYKWYRYSLPDRRLTRIEKGESKERGLRGQVQKALRDELHDCIEHTDTGIACIRENSTTPPEVVMYQVAKTSVSAAKVLTHLNPELDSVKLGDVRSLRGAPEDGVDSGLILPVDYVPGRQYPLVTMLYNQYKRNRFTGKPDFTSYAPQVFAGQGYVVLLQTKPRRTVAYRRGDFSAARASEADGMSLSLRSMLDQLISEGLVDSKHMGIMGWSWGAFLVPYILTNHPEWLQAAAIGDGCNHQPTIYWLGDSQLRQQEDRYFGEGGPYGTNADRWRSVAPIYNVGKLRVPMLMEYSELYLCGIDLHRSILDQGGQAELYIYPRESHVFDLPANRYASMGRHLEWFNFWLLGREVSAPEKRDQYLRWNQLKIRHEALPMRSQGTE